MSRRAGPNRAALARTRQRAQRDPSSAQGSFSIITEWRDGARALSRTRTFEIDTDEPEVLGGTDQAPDPMELLLAALGSCLTIGWVRQAEVRGVTLRHIKVTVEAAYDLRGFLDPTSGERPGFKAMSYRVDVDCDAAPDMLAEIKLAAERMSPMFDNIINATPLQGTVITGAVRQGNDAVQK